MPIHHNDDLVSVMRRRLLLAAAGLAGASMFATARAAQYEEISWDDLSPKDWDPAKSFQDMQNLQSLPDTDVRVQRMYKRMREAWDKAPVVPSMDGRAVKIPGYIVTLEETKQGLKEFLLVPYFGACIHTPPPPANQIIHVYCDPVQGLKTMDPVWAMGKIGLERATSSMGVSGYTMMASKIEKFVDKTQQGDE